MSLLSSVAFLPLIGAFLILAVPGQKKEFIKSCAVVFTVIQVLLIVCILAGFDKGAQGFQLVERAAWIPSFGAQYIVGIDGISLVLLLLLGILCLVALVSSLQIQTRVKEYFFFFLMFEGSVAGVLIALDLFLFYLFWMVSIIPVYFLMGIWGGENRKKAAMSFFLFLLCGGMCVMLGLLGIYFTVDPHTFDWFSLSADHYLFTGRNASLLFWILFTGFAVSIPVVPLHTWFFRSQDDSPPAVTLLISGIYIKLGLYGIIRIVYPILPGPAQQFSTAVIVVGVLNVLYGSFIAFSQHDLKKTISSCSISHMGFCLIGIASISVAGLSGAVFHLFNHGIFTAALVLLTGMLFNRLGPINTDSCSGLGEKLPVTAGSMTIASFAAMGIPGCASFISIFMCLLGVFPAHPAAAVAGLIGILILAGFFLRLLERIFFGDLPAQAPALSDLSTKELVMIAPLLVLMLFFGVYPSALLTLLNATTTHMIGFFP